MLDFRLSPTGWQPPVWPLWGLIIFLFIGLYVVITG